MGKIGDLWVRLGLKKDDFSRGIKEAQSETAGFSGSALASLGKIAAKFAVVATAVVGVIGVIKKLATENQVLTDAFGRMKEGMSAAFGVLARDLANLDFSHLLSDMREARSLARDLYDAMDAMGEIQTAYNITASKQAVEMNRLKAILRDVGATDEERLAAGEKLLEIYRKLEENPTRGLNTVSDATLDKYLQQMGYKIKGVSGETLKEVRAQFVEMFEWLGTEQGQAAISAAEAAHKMFGGDVSKYWKDMRAAGLTDQQIKFAEKYVTTMGDKKRLEVEQAVTAAYQQQAKYSGETLRITTMMNSVRNHQDSQTTGGTPAAPKEDPNLKRVDDILERVRNANATELELMTAKYQEEKALLEAYHKDTLGLTDEYFDNMLSKIDKGVSEEIDRMKDIEPLALDDFVDMDAADQIISDFLAQMEYAQQRAQALADEFTASVVYGFSDGVQEIMDQLHGLSEFNTGRIFQRLLEPLADMAIRQGELLMAEGAGVEAAKDALISLNPGVAIAAGAALIALGVAVKSGLASIAQRGSAAQGVTSTSEAASTALTQAASENMELTVHIEGRLSGNDIVLAAQRTEAAWAR